MQCNIDFNWIMVGEGTQSSWPFRDVAVLFPTQKKKSGSRKFDPPPKFRFDHAYPCLFLSAVACATLPSTLHRPSTFVSPSPPPLPRLLFRFVYSSRPCQPYSRVARCTGRTAALTSPRQSRPSRASLPTRPSANNDSSHTRPSSPREQSSPISLP
jgi:hypothetical protein